jgi:glycosyltransferase involved in cell wall biosynthesis
MHIKKKPDSTVLITTPDYLPKLGGLTTFTIGLEKVLNDLGVIYDILVWNSVSELKDCEHKRNYDQCLHVHFMAGHFLRHVKSDKVINFIHGSEILFYSPNPIKRLVKKWMKRSLLKYIESSFINVFISDVTKELLVNQGLTQDYSRDLTLHNCIDTSSARLTNVSFDEDELRFICVARDVPHKNIEGALDLCSAALKVFNKSIKLYVTAPLSSRGGVVVENIQGIENDELELLYQKSHFNILLSLDHSHKGFVEGFGLTVLESGKYGVPSIVSSNGGLPEAVHHQITGWVLDTLDRGSHEYFWTQFSIEEYKQIRLNTYQHTIDVHGLDYYKRFMEKCLR